jgi:hypothetical protein
MPNQRILLEGAVVTLAVAWGIKSRIETRQLAKVFLTTTTEYEETQRANETQIQYLCRVLDKNGIPVDAFDLITLNYHH